MAKTTANAAPQLPSWDDLLSGTSLNMGNLAELVAKALAVAPDGATKDQISEVVNRQLANAFSIGNIAQAQIKVGVALVDFVKKGGSGPVQKSPTDGVA